MNAYVYIRRNLSLYFSLGAALKASLRIASYLCSIIIGHREDSPLPALAPNIHFSMISLKSILNSALWVIQWRLYGFQAIWARPGPVCLQMHFSPALRRSTSWGLALQLHCPASLASEFLARFGQWEALAWGRRAGRREKLGTFPFLTPLSKSVALPSCLCPLCGSSCPQMPPPCSGIWGRALSWHAVNTFSSLGVLADPCCC